MRKTLLLLALFFSVYNLYSQPDSVLKKFKFRDVNYRTITFEVNGGGNYANVDYVTLKNTTHSVAGAFGSGYSILKSTDHVLLNASANAGISYGTSKASYSSSENKNSSFYFTPGITVLNKWFSKEFFLEAGVDADADLISQKNSYTNPPNTRKNHDDNYSLSFTAGAGKGRLENVTSMQNALWLQDALITEGRLKHSLSAGQLIALGNTIVKANNTRVLDYRKRTQFILETVDNYLRQNELIENADIKYFSNLNDILFFALNYPRLSGTEKFIRLMPAIAYQDVDQSESMTVTNNTRSSTAKSARLSAGINRHMPANLHHQNNYGVSIYANYREIDGIEESFVSGVLVNEFRTNPLLHQAGASLFFEHAIYPNTRTVINFNLQSEGGYQKFDGESSAYGSVNLYGALNYFISYRTRFTCSLGASYQSNMYGFDHYYYYLQLIPDNIQVYGNAGLQISL